MQSLRFVIVGLAGMSVFASACGGSAEETQTTVSSGAGVGGASTSSGADAGSGGSMSSGEGVIEITPSIGFAAAHAAAPKIITLGGPVLKAPRIYPIYFSNDDKSVTTKLTDFISKIGSGSYWKAGNEEYGIGAATSGAPIQLSEAAPSTATNTEIQQWLAAKLNAHDPAFPVADENTLFAIFYPPGSSIKLDFGIGQGSSCQSFSGYHLNTTLDDKHGSLPVAYAVIPRCSQYHGLTGIDALTAVASHEIVEGAQDPYVLSNPAYLYVDPAHSYWSTAMGGGESADLCAQSLDTLVKDTEIGYVVQRPWSNQQAAQSHDPCAPATPGEPYFNSALLLPDKITLAGQSTPVNGVKIPVGETRTVEVDLFSDAMTSGPWKIEMLDISAPQAGGPTLSLNLDKESGVNGDKLNLDITVLQPGPNNAEIFLLISTLGKRHKFWVGLVGN